MLHTKSILSFGLLLGATAAAHAAPITFVFSFSNLTGNIAGTVTGRIFGLQDNGVNQAATSLIIDSFPAGLAVADGINNSNALTWNAVQGNLFTVVNGVVTSEQFAAQHVDSVRTDTFFLGAVTFTTNCCGTVANSGLSLDNGLRIVGGANPTITSVPEPGTFALLGIGVFGAALAKRKLGAGQSAA